MTIETLIIARRYQSPLIYDLSYDQQAIVPDVSYSTRFRGRRIFDIRAKAQHYGPPGDDLYAWHSSYIALFFRSNELLYDVDNPVLIVPFELKIARQA